MRRNAPSRSPLGGRFAYCARGLVIVERRASARPLQLKLAVIISEKNDICAGLRFDRVVIAHDLFVEAQISNMLSVSADHGGQLTFFVQESLERLVDLKLPSISP